MSLGLAPLVPLWLVALAVLVSLLVAGFALWRGMAGWALRGLALAALAAALAGPQILRTERQALDDIVILLDDRSASQELGTRAAQTDAALARLEAQLAAMPGMQLRRVTLGDDPDGTRLATALNRAVSAEPEGRLAGVLLLSDGRLHDAPALPAAAAAPVHLLLSGAAADWDRRLVIEEAPLYGLIGEPVEVLLRVEDEGAVPDTLAGQPATLHVEIDGGPAGSAAIPVGQTFALTVVPEHGGPNVVSLRLDPPEGGAPQLTDRNDAAALTVMGVRDRLKVLLVSGEPHAGLRAWRNLLKSDASVDLIHFTILRPPEKFDGVAADEMALIAFPVDDLFTQKIGDFDLIIFDRYRVRGILPPAYFDNIRRYVENGGAVLVSSGPEAVGVEGLGFTPLGQALPATPTGGLIEAPFRPAISDLGRRHPVTAGLPGGEGEVPQWGPWLRRIEADIRDGAEVVMEGEGQPLLVLDHYGEGRVAQLLSDQIWLWGHEFEGGGPQRELLRRIAHWAMAEPELEEEALEAAILPGEAAPILRITRRSLAEAVGPVAVTAPDGSRRQVTLHQAAPGRFAADMPATEEGLYRLAQGDLSRLVAVGPAAPREFEAPLASADALRPLVEATGGAVLRLEEATPDLRLVSPGAATHGTALTGPWLGLVARGAQTVTGQRAAPLLPGWGWLALVAGLVMAAWLREGGRLARMPRR